VAGGAGGDVEAAQEQECRPDAQAPVASFNAEDLKPRRCKRMYGGWLPSTHDGCLHRLRALCRTANTAPTT